MMIFLPCLGPEVQLSIKGPATGSSILSDAMDLHAPDFAVDGMITQGLSTYFYHSNVGDIVPWFQVEISSHMEVNRVVIVNRHDCCGAQLVNVGVHIGRDPAISKELTTNPICAIFEGPSTNGAVEDIPCEHPMSGQFVIIQLRNPFGSEFLQINELYLYGTSDFTGTHKCGESNSCKLLPFQ